MGVLILFLYILGYSAARAAGQLGSREFELVVELLAKIIVASICISVTGALAQKILFAELELLARKAASRMVTGNVP